MTRPNVARVLAGLKDFQRETVDYVFQRMYLDADHVRRFLLADEVGLGKTLVTRGVVAKAVDHLWETIDRIDVVYICSNNDIARQNVNRLRLDDGDEFTLATRITLLPVQIKALRNRRVNFVSFTPGTSFDLKSRTGIVEERVLLFRLLRDRWRFTGAAPVEIFRVDVKADRFKRLVKEHQYQHPIDPDIERAIEAAILRDFEVADAAKKPSLEQRFHELVDRIRASNGRVREDAIVARRELVADLRALLGETCLEALEPDLIILDEFQRFKHLLTDDDDASRLARRLFNYSDEITRAKLLLVSATPYKMFTTPDEPEGDDHYRDFLTTIDFLMEDGARTERCSRSLSDYRRALMRLPEDGDEPLRRAKGELEAELRRVMVRTERLAATTDRDGMLVEKICEPLSLEADDALDFVYLERAAEALGEVGTLEYWKSAPYVLSFMDHYNLKRALTTSTISGDPAEGFVADIVQDRPSLGVPWRTVTKYGAVDMRNPRLRWLAHDTLARGVWRLLWMPPSMPSYEAAGSFADSRVKGFTKRLVFSSWQIVPKAIASLLSYEAERSAILSAEPGASNTAEARTERRGLIRFARSDGRPGGMPSLLLFYPSFSLAEIGDVRYAAEPWQNRKAVDWVDHCRRRIEQLLDGFVTDADERGSEDERWYWAAPILLDLAANDRAARTWLSNVQLAHDWVGGTIAESDGADGEEGSDVGWRAHVTEICKALEPLGLGRRPADLSRVLADAAVAAPGVAALRALGRIAGGQQRFSDPHLRTSAAQLAWGFRTLFNVPEAMALLRAGTEGIPYWKLVLKYTVEGDLSAVLEEYAHVLVESLGLSHHNRFGAAAKVAAHARQVLSLRTSTLGIDEIRARKVDRRLVVEDHRMRTRFAMRFGEQSTDEVEAGRLKGGGVEKTRANQVRDAFNSPFWPFVLASTSIGQEGLDFHQYCHAIVHWNVPANPVDIEQREGRIHRFKGHAIRKNVASRYGHAAVGMRGDRDLADPWEQVFRAAARDRQPGTSDLIPYWITPGSDGAKIERYVPALRSSRDWTRYQGLLQSLAVYRMVFGQNRQEDVLKYLMQAIDFDRLSTLLNGLHINLSPVDVGKSGEVVLTPDEAIWEPRDQAARYQSTNSTGRLRRPPAGEARNRARGDPHAARQVFATAFPRAESRRVVEQQLAASIRAAHAVHSRGWGITLFAGGGALLRLNAGSLETMVVRQETIGRIWLSVRPKYLSKEIRQRLRSADGPRIDWGSPYPSEPEARVVTIADEELVEWFPLLAHAHLEMVRLASSHVRTQSAWRAQHSPGVIDYLRQEGFEVPSPAYESPP